MTSGPSFLAVEIEINHGCNRKCSYCPNSTGKRKETGHMDKEVFETILSQLKSINYRGRVSYHFYNEPLLSPNLSFFVRRTKEELPQSFVDLFTNGTLLTYEKFSELNKSGVDKFTITEHENIKNYQFTKTLEQLTGEEKRKVYFHDYSKLDFSNRGGTLENTGPEITSKTKVRPCLIPRNLLVITVKGNVLPCYEDFHQNNIMGNITEKHISEIWNSPKYTDFRDSLKKGNRSSNPVCLACNNTKLIL